MLNRRQFIGAMGAAAAGLGLAACSDDSSSDSGSTSEGTKKIAMFMDGSINDGGWGASCYSALTGAAEELGWESAYSESVSTSDWSTVMTNYVDQGFDIVFAPGAQYADTVKQVAADNPDCHFVILNYTLEGDNIESLVPDTAQIGYLAGALAGILSQTKHIGFVGGTELDTTKTKLENYTAAAQKIDPSIEVTSAYAGSFTDAAKGKELGSSMVNNNDVDVMFGDASVVDTGVREALSEADGTRYDIGQPGDIGGASDTLIACSVVTDNQTMLAQAMQDLVDGNFGNKTITGDLSNGGVAVGTFSDTLVTAEQQAEFTEYVEQIEAGTFL